MNRIQAEAISVDEYYDSLLDLFSTSGWKRFIEDQDQHLSILIDTAATDCADNTSWQNRRGQINELTHIVNYERFIRASIEQRENPQQDTSYDGLDS